MAKRSSDFRAERLCVLTPALTDNKLTLHSEENLLTVLVAAATGTP